MSGDDVLGRMLMLEQAAEACDALSLRPASLGGRVAPVLGARLDPAELTGALAPALAAIGEPDLRPQERVEDFLGRVRAACLDRLDKWADKPRALAWTPSGREHTLEQLRVEVDDLRAAVGAEDAWRALPAWGAHGEALAELAFAGFCTKLRAVGTFLLQEPRIEREDEPVAEYFLPAGEWRNQRDAHAAETVRAFCKTTNKQIAHLTLTRPIPEDRAIYRYSLPVGPWKSVERLLDHWTRLVDTRLLPDWWVPWVEELPGEGL